MKSTNKTYNNIYPFYESARQAKIERDERNKKQKKSNSLKQIKKREDCLKRATITEDSELESLLFNHRLRRKFKTIKAWIARFKYWSIDNK